MQGDNVNSTVNVQEKLDHRQDENNQIQRNSTILDSNNAIPPFIPETNLTLQGRDQIKVINHESRRLSHLSLAHHTAEESILNSNHKIVSSTPSPFVRRVGSSAQNNFPLQQPQQEQIDIDIDQGLNCMQSENNTANDVFNFVTNCQNNLPSRSDVDPAINSCSHLGYVDRESSNIRHAGHADYRKSRL